MSAAAAKNNLSLDGFKETSYAQLGKTREKNSEVENIAAGHSKG